MKSGFFKRIIISIGVILFCLSPASAAEKFISVSDIHFDPFASCRLFSLRSCPLIQKLKAAPATEWASLFEQEGDSAFAPYGQDTNYALLKSSVVALHRVYQTADPRFVLILGDFLAHHFREQYVLYARDSSQVGYEQFVKKTLAFLTQEIRNAFPKGDIYPVIGNNDSYTGDYGVVPKGRFLSDATHQWQAFLVDKSNRKRFLADFPIGGYYAVNSPTNPHQRILILNTVLFSTSVQGPHTKEAAKKELQWLHDQLMSAAMAHQSLLLAFHIPVGINVYATLKNVLSGIQTFWQPDYTETFSQDLTEFSGIITAMLPGHIHMDGFQVLAFTHPDDIPVSFTPSISPIFGNNPGFKVYSYDSNTFQLSDFETYFLPLDRYDDREWQKEYNFNSVYRAEETEPNLLVGMQELTPMGHLVNVYKHYYAVGQDAQPITKDHNWLPYYWCNIHAITMQAYQACLHVNTIDAESKKL